MAQIQKETISKYVIALQQLKDECEKNNNYIGTAKRQSIYQKNGVSYDTLTLAVRASLAMPLQKAHYKWNIIYVEPIHARKCLEYKSKQAKVSYKKMRKKQNSAFEQNTVNNYQTKEVRGISTSLHKTKKHPNAN